MQELIGKHKYFVHKGTWKNNYEWRIQEVEITGVKVAKDKQLYAEFGFGSCGYEYPVSYLKDTLKEAKAFAIQQISEEKEWQIKQINS